MVGGGLNAAGGGGSKLVGCCKLGSLTGGLTDGRGGGGKLGLGGKLEGGGRQMGVGRGCGYKNSYKKKRQKQLWLQKEETKNYKFYSEM